ncbi:MAG: DNA internalization-related competence protein ComEC/Rec2 [Pseudonocardiaceae bacterium]
MTDLRLLPAALAAWAVALIGLYLGWTATAVVGVTGAVVAVTGARTAARCGAAAVATGGVAAALAVVVGGHAWVLDHHPVRAAAERGGVATVEVVLRDDPRPLMSAGYGGRPGTAERVVVRGALSSADLAGRRWDGGGRIVLLAPAQGWAGLLPGQRVRAEGLLAPAGRADLTTALLRVRGAPVVLGEPSTVHRAAGTLRSGLRDAAGVLSPESAGLLPALVVGDTSGMVPEVREEFRAAGLTHLTAVSGTNVAIVCGAVLGLARLAGAGPRTAAVAAGVALVGFVVLARPSPSVLRAAVMGAVTLLALVAGRERSALPALSAAVIGLLVVDPALGGDPGFTLSVLATGALVLVAPIWAAGLRDHGVPVGVAEALAVPAAAHLVTAPVVAGLSGAVSLVAIPANLLAVPAVAPATVLGVLAALLGLVHPWLAEAAVHVAGPAVGWLVAVGRHAAAVPDGVLHWPGGARGGLLLAAVTVAVLLALRGPRFRVLVAAAAVGAALVVVPTRYVAPGWPAPGWVVVACDVGQGDAVVLATAQPGRAVLVDTGAEPGPVAGCLDRLGVRSLALVVLSHLHADHVGGLAGALRGRAVAAVALGPGRSPPWALDEVRRTATAAGVPLVALGAGHRLAWPGLVLDVLGPRQVPSPSTDRDAEVDGSVVNNASVVLRATTAAGRVLLTGDVELEAQADLLTSGVDLRADILKVPHHGSRYTAGEFLAAVRPRVALVSVGADNSYGHPNPQVLDTLAARGSRVLRTDRGGDLAVAATRHGPAVVARGDPRPAR